ncbi:hypothetical protein SAMN05421831_104115 [Allopseudospirillum japonicum]|uniref:Uncharacterized protein n=1 Tax=Allopseudospirillum japonicum TaxID=64971 RepID=A0A1H6RKQ6_9GAMM|nr:hypothetical protein [Allopseudospirillum japonicum]SEI56388.1 hypothetical protein SAMN05421831_104115 [Allopseudospirillum japonicum]
MGQQVQRLHYLQAFGICQWVPRVRLPYAAPSPVCAWPQPQSPHARAQDYRQTLLKRAHTQTLASASVQQTSTAKVAPTNNPLPTSKAQDTDQAQAPASVAASPSIKLVTEQAPAQPTQAQTEIHLDLTLDVLTNGWWILRTTPSAAQRRLQQKLLAQILFAWHPQVDYLTSQRFVWPFPHLPVTEIMRQPEQARLSLYAYLTGHQFKAIPRHHLLVCGDELTTWIHSSLDYHLWPNLDTLLKDPQQKARFWHQQQALRAQFAASPLLL